MNRPRRISLVLVSAVALAVAIIEGSRQVDASAEDEAMAVLDRYMEAFNARDEVAWAKTLNYPHVRIASRAVRVWQNEQEYTDYMDFDRFAAQSGGWSRSQWDSRTIVQEGEDKVHLAVGFTRFNEKGEKIESFDSLYIVTKVDGHWGVQARSSFAP
ncbi:MAG: hypothetical protein AAB353_06950 [Candidatus Hydrogenedentota bacterium]